MPSNFPDSTNTQPVTVSVLPTGYLKHPDRWIFEDGDTDIMGSREVYPDFSFLIEHALGRKVLFDLGMPKDFSVIPPLIRNGFHIVEPYVPNDAIDILQQGTVDPLSIDTIIVSHLHFDHVGDCSKWPHVTILAGPGSRQFCAPGWPAVEQTIFASEILQHEHYKEVEWDASLRAIGTFNKTFDFFGDGSLILVDCPGHMPGHIGAVANTGHDEWVFLGGDCCHHPALLSGKRPMSITVGPAGSPCFHKDPLTAQTTIKGVAELQETGDVLVCLAHDNALNGKIPEYPKSINGWKNAGWKHAMDDGHK